MLKNTADQGAYVYAVDTVADPVVGKIGDAANITADISKDGAVGGVATNDTNPTEVGGGLYWFNFTQAETLASQVMALIPISTTPGVVLDPVIIPIDLTATVMKANKVLEKDGAVWYLRVYAVGDAAGVPTILNKAIKDFEGNDIDDLVAGVLATELESII